MSILVYAESWEGRFRKSTYEAASYANELANDLELLEGKNPLYEKFFNN